MRDTIKPIRMATAPQPHRSTPTQTMVQIKIMRIIQIWSRPVPIRIHRPPVTSVRTTAAHRVAQVTNAIIQTVLRPWMMKRTMGTMRSAWWSTQVTVAVHLPPSGIYSNGSQCHRDLDPAAQRTPQRVRRNHRRKFSDNRLPTPT